MNKLIKKIGCFALAGFSLFAMSACGTIQGEEPEDLDISIWDGQTITSVEDFAQKVVADGQDAKGKKYNSVKISEAADFVAAMRDINNFENFTIELEKDIDMGDLPWGSAEINGDSSALGCTITIDGDNNTIYGLTNMLISKAHLGGTSIVIKDLTIEQANIVVDAEDVNEDVAVGAFVGDLGGGIKNVTFDNCHLVNSLVEGGHWTGGIYGKAAGYSQANSPVFMDVLINDCSVKGNLITGKGSVGAIAGHATGAVWTKVVVQNANVDNNEINSTGSSNVKAGVVFGTIGAAGDPFEAVNGVTKTGGSYINNLTYSDNDVYSNQEIVNRVYGRLAGGKLYVDGVLIVE